MELTKSNSKDSFSCYNLLPLRLELYAPDSSLRDLSKLSKFEVSWEAMYKISRPQKDQKKKAAIFKITFITYLN